MFTILDLQTIKDTRGDLTVIENVLPFSIARVFYIYNVAYAERGGHRHKNTRQAAVCITGSCTIYMDNGKIKEKFVLNNPNKCLLIEPQDWHTMTDFSPNAVLLVFASEKYNKDDYIYEKY